jgi:hypothetical protein
MSSIPYRAIPISLESNKEWLKLSLKRRELFLFLMRKAVSIESYLYKGEILTYGQYVWSLNKLREKFNETLNPEDQYSRSGLQEALQHLYKINFINKGKFGTTVHAETVVTVTYSDSCELIKTKLRTAFDDLRTPAVQPQDSSAVQPKVSENIVDDISRDGIKEHKKSSSVQPEISLNKVPPYTQHDLTQSNTNDNVYIRHCPDDAFQINKLTQEGVQASHKYKLTAEQQLSLSWLESQKINTRLGTLCWWSKNYSLERLKCVYKAVCAIKKKRSIGALMTTFLRKDVPVGYDSIKENYEFFPGFRDQYPEFNWELKETLVICEYGNIKKEIPLKYNPNLFVDTLFRTMENLRGAL